MFRRLLLSLALIAALSCSAAAPAFAGCPGEGTAPSASTLAGVRSATLCLLNQRRAQAGLPALASDRLLGDAATRFSSRMVAERFFAHESPDGTKLTDRLRASGYLTGLSGWSIGENIAYGSGSYATAASTVQRWMESPGHRANILSGRFRAIGIGIVSGTPRSASGATFTTDFGSAVRSAGAAAPPASQPGPQTSPAKAVKHGKKTRRSRRARRSCRRVRRSRRASRAEKRRCARSRSRRSRTRRR